MGALALACKRCRILQDLELGNAYNRRNWGVRSKGFGGVNGKSPL